MPADLVPWLPIIGGAVVAAIAGGLTIWNRRGGDRAKREPTWGELVKENRDLRKEMTEFRSETEERFDRIDKKFGAMERVLTSLGDQWQGDPPELDPVDIEELGTTLPVKFRPIRRGSGKKE